MKDDSTAGTGNPRPSATLLSGILAFAIVTLGAVAYSYFVQARSMFPADALIIQTHGHNDKALQAVRGADIPTLTIVDTSQIHAASFLTSLTFTACYLAAVFIGYYCVLALLKRFTNATGNALSGTGIREA